MKDILTKEEKEEQKKLKEELKEFCKKEYIKDISNVFKYKNDYYIFNKPKIETSFCFGYGYNGISTDEQEVTARNNRNIARTDTLYFLKENLKGIFQELIFLNKFKKEIKRDKERAKIKLGYYDFVFYNVIPLNYYKIDENDKRQIMVISSSTCWCSNQDDFKTNIDITLIDKIIKAKKIQIIFFKKRLYSYLKKYGLSKINTWTYLID